MAEELTSNVAPSTPSEDSGVATGQSNEQASRASAEPQTKPSSSDGASTPERGAEKPKQKSGVNLYEIPEFRQFQSQLTRQQQQERQQYQRQLQEYEQRMQQLEEANLDDYEKAQRRAERAEQKLISFQQNIAQQQQQEQAYRQILEDMQMVSTKTGIPVEQLYSAESLDRAWDMGIEYMRQEGSTKAEQDDARREANRTVVGGGKASTPTTRKEREFQRAMEERDPVAYIRALRQKE